ncbi:MAG TPA: DEAD/DEAH box helicase [Anaerolineae bacterium]|nr:DEAD/DEAH box helicase [Anaerolineae bacterium]
MTNQNFSDLGLHAELVQTVNDRGYTEPTEIQTAVIPTLLNGQDVLGQAPTGTGKTAAFALPLIQKLNPNGRNVQALIIAPTRELAKQVASAIYDYGKHAKISVLSIYGGQAYGRQISRLRKGVDVVVGTPGRLLDLIQKGKLDLSELQTLVLDEADEMLSMGFIEDIEEILKATPAERQTALFSATLPKPIRHLANKYMNNPVEVMVRKQQLTVAAIEQRAYLVNEKDKLAALTRLFDLEDITSAIVFSRTRVRTGELAAELSKQGYPAQALNGDLSQDARERILGRFRDNQIQILVATDVAARGLDIDDISHVFNYDLPHNPDSFVHRVGRTGRAGREGIAISFVTPREKGRLQRIERHAKQKIEVLPLPTKDEIIAYRDSQLMKRMEVWLLRDRCHREKTMVEEWVEAGHDPIAIAAAALKLARADEKQRPIAEISPVNSSSGRNDRRDRNGRGRNDSRQNGGGRSNGRSRRNNSHEEGMTRLVISAGKNHGVRPGDVVGTIAYHADIPGKSLGAIHIERNETFVDVPNEFAAQVLAQNGKYQIHRQDVTVEPTAA